MIVQKFLCSHVIETEKTSTSVIDSYLVVRTCIFRCLPSFILESINKKHLLILVVFGSMKVFDYSGLEFVLFQTKETSN